jgi:hypothetical protein
MPAKRLVDNMIKILSGERLAKFVQGHFRISPYRPGCRTLSS